MYTTGVRYSVSTCETRRPPTTARPRGWRDSAPAPIPSAIGSVPIRAAIVVIMIGRKRTLAALRIASAGPFPSVRAASIAKSIIIDRVLLDDADEHDEPDESVDVEILPEEAAA